MTNLSYLKSFLFLAIFLAPSLAFAVTQKEMEQARTIATKAYLRYANDGSGYLDDINPTTMSELESQLKAKELENIKAFKEIPVPSDYKDWNKEKLLQYWAVTAFQNSNLLEKGRGGRLRARTQINKMTVTEPQIASPAAENGDEAATTPETPAQEPVQEVVEVPAPVEDVTQAPPVETPAQKNYDPLAGHEIQNEEDSIAHTEEEIAFDNSNLEKQSSDSWVYIMVLCILVAIVIGLVIYAANVMKKNNKKAAEQSAGDPQINERLEHYENTMGEKQNEILMLSKKLESSNRQNSELKAQVEALGAQLAAIKGGAAISEHQHNPQSHHEHRKDSSVRKIFLGRANAKGIFVRADRSLNLGNSVFVLETSDGFSGSFKVADSPAAWSLALSNPREYLETACSGQDLDYTSNASQIVTEQSGTAVFEGGCWRVIRKARIRYE